MLPLSSEKINPKVIVIGAGIAGLTTAYRLQNAGVNVELYEARSRVGGRIFTATIHNRIAELGGQNLCDGGKRFNNLHRLIDEFGLELTSSRIYLKHSYFTKQSLTSIKKILKEKRIDPEIIKKQIDKLALSSSNIQEVLEGMVDKEDPLYKILSVRMAAYEGGTIDKLSPLYAETLFHMMLGGICSTHQKNIEEDSYVDLVSIKGGNALLPEKIAKNLASKLHLNMPLVKVIKDKNGLYTLTFKNGKEVKSDLLVLAIPCSIYKQITFGEGVISPHKLNAIQNVQYGENAKIMVPFTTPPPNTDGLIGDKIVSFFDSLEQILTVYYTGQSSLFSSETITNAYAEARPMIEMGFGKNCPPFNPPQYAQDQSNLSYDGPIGYSWPNDPYARGSYSYIASGQECILTATETEDGEVFKKLFAPIQKSLYFIGEHASILSEVPGTMEAACESGERIARFIIAEND